MTYSNASSYDAPQQSMDGEVDVPMREELLLVFGEMTEEERAVMLTDLCALYCARCGGHIPSCTCQTIPPPPCLDLDELDAVHAASSDVEVDDDEPSV